ncbi:GUN4 domain-containing protein [Nostoc sp. C110]|uniref:GUN4 domain-containing protein n=1 Tax=Nostoc sp. C110 TaxID=3349876 RepID=UPI00370DC730
MPEISLQLFFSYSHKDETLRDELAKHLTILEWQGVISSWHDRKILPGEEWDHQINDNLNTADIILLLISSDFLFSKYCWDVEVKKAIELHHAGEACVIPVILRSVDWSGAPFGKLQALPKNAEPVVSRHWHNQDEAFTDVAKGIRAAAEKLKKKRDEQRQTQEVERLQLQEQEKADKLRLEQQSTGNDLLSEKGVNYKRLRDLLKAGQWKEADIETLAVMLKASGREQEGWLNSESLSNFPCTDLRTIDKLWVKYSNGHFGFSVQKRIWESVAKDYTKFSDRVGNMKSTFALVNSPRGNLPRGNMADNSKVIWTSVDFTSWWPCLWYLLSRQDL